MKNNSRANEWDAKDQRQAMHRTYHQEKSEDVLWEVQHELVSYAFLLRGLGPTEESCDDLYGLGVALDRIARRIANIAERVTRLDK